VRDGFRTPLPDRVHPRGAARAAKRLVLFGAPAAEYVRGRAAAAAEIGVGRASEKALPRSPRRELLRHQLDVASQIVELVGIVPRQLQPLHRAVDALQSGVDLGDLLG